MNSEVPDAIRLAAEIGFDSLNLATPNSVKDDDPSLEAMDYPGPAEHREVVFRSPAAPFSGSLEPYGELIEAAVQESIEARWRSATDGKDPAGHDKSGDRCDWLNLAVISDAMGRIVPCRLGDYLTRGRFDFASIKDGGGNIMNSGAYQEARQHVLDPSAAGLTHRHRPVRDRVMCVQCPGRPLPQVALSAVRNYLTSISAFDDLTYLYDWSRHNSEINPAVRGRVAVGS